MTLMEQYDAAIVEHDIENDSAQRMVIDQLQRLADELTSSRPLWVKLGLKKAVHGLYIYGPVGVGKTFLMDMFYEYVAEPHKARFHFHQFMQQVDTQLRRLQGQKDPLRRIAAHLAKTTRLLCFDEFLVYDVADAMMLSELLQAILAKGVVLVATSNSPPDDLYYNGVQRDRFLPAISLIKQHCRVLGLKEQRDYRLGRLSLSQAYLSPLDKTTEQILIQQFSSMTKKVKTGMDLSIQNRRIPCVQYGDRIVWFRFDVICNLPRSQLDYLEIAERFDTVFVTDIPVLTSHDTVRAILLIHFIDVMYDKGVRLVISAAAPADQLYIQGEMLTAFQRTLSRLEEMQSEDYLRRHKRRQSHSL